MKRIMLLLGLSFSYLLSLSQEKISLEKQGGVYLIPCKVNGLSLKFIFDSGANDVSISLTEAQFMLKNGYLKANDITGKETFQDAKGEITVGATINIKELVVGSTKLNNVRASVVPTLQAPLLLGQSALQRFGQFTFDYATNTLILGKPNNNSDLVKNENPPTEILKPGEIPKGWHMLDKATSGYYGISVDKAYDFIKAKKLKSKTVIVAIIDSGIDTTHEDLKNVLWHNPGEIPGNGIDDDKNGYVDDVYGWDFLGGHDGKNVEQDSYEAARVYHNGKTKWGGKTIDESHFTSQDSFDYSTWKRAEKEVAGGESKSSGLELVFLQKAYTNCLKSDTLLRKAIGKDKYTGKELGDFSPTDPDVKKAKTTLYSLMAGNDAMETTNQDFLEGFGDYVSGEQKKADAANTPPENYRGNIVKDNYGDFNDRFYGNPDVMSSNKAALHGTHVSGIIGASRKNGVGMDGIADNVKIMMVRAVPDGDEHDKDIALAIRYAVDNGAQVINMSFGKGYSPEKKWVDDAVRYAESKSVLMVHAAGNDAKDIDTTYNFPTPVFLDGKRAGNWITVGASGPKNDAKGESLIANFSNYGKTEVDVFAPGVKIYSTVPGGNTYQNLQGTSMASPVVAGLAALILEYYPNLSARQVKMVIEKSAVKLTDNVKNPETGEMVSLSSLCKSGGVVNAYEAIKLASTIKGERKKAPVKVTKSTVKPKVKG